MIEGVMSIMEGDEGWTDKNIKNCSYFQMGGHRKIGTQKNWDTEKLEDRKIEEQRIHKNS